MHRAFLMAGLGFLAGLTTASSQSGTGIVRGQVTDPAGASIPGALVIANNSRGLSRSGTSDVRGVYVLANLPAGTYTVRVSAKGFAPIERTEVALAAGVTQTVDFPLSLATANQSVTVSDSSQAIQVDPGA